MATATAVKFVIGDRVKIIGRTECNGGVGEEAVVIGYSGNNFFVNADKTGGWYVAAHDLQHVAPAKKKAHVTTSNKSHAGSVLQKMKRSQNSDVLKHLIKRGDISQYEANNLYRVTRLASRIHEIKKNDITITSETRYDLTGKRYVRYFLQ